MSIGIPVPQDMVFGPETTTAIGAAFDNVCRSLSDTGQPSFVKEVIARRIIELARAGESDPDRLCTLTLKELGFDTDSNCSR